MKYFIKISQKNLLLVALIACTFFTNIALAHNHFTRVKIVDCNIPDASVQNVVDKIRFDRDVTIYIVGFCNESVAIVSDGVTLSGNQNGDGMIGGGLAEVIVTGAQRVEIEYLELTGPGYGVLVQEASSAYIRHNNIHDNEDDGVGVYNLAFAKVEFNSVTGNGRPDPYFESGISVWGGSSVRSKGNLITDNGYSGVGVGNQSYFRSGLDTEAGPPAPADLDVILQKGCAQGQTAGTCGSPGTIALDCFRSGTCDYRNTDVTGIVEVGRASYLDARTSIINGDVIGFDGAGIFLRDTVSGSGLLSCSGGSYANGSVGCGDTIP